MTLAMAVQLIQGLVGILELAQLAGVDVQRLLDVQRKAREEGRDLTDEELNEFREAARASLRAAKEA